MTSREVCFNTKAGKAIKFKCAARKSKPRPKKCAAPPPSPTTPSPCKLKKKKKCATTSVPKAVADPRKKGGMGPKKFDTDQKSWQQWDKIGP